MKKLLKDMTELELQHLCSVLGTAIREMAVREGVEAPLFVLLLFNDPKVSQYVSNVERGSVIKALREAAFRLETRQDVPR